MSGASADLCKNRKVLILTFLLWLIMQYTSFKKLQTKREIGITNREKLHSE